MGLGRDGEGRLCASYVACVVGILAISTRSIIVFENGQARLRLAHKDSEFGICKTKSHHSIK